MKPLTRVLRSLAGLVILFASLTGNACAVDLSKALSLGGDWVRGPQAVANNLASALAMSRGTSGLDSSSLTPPWRASAARLGPT